MPPTVEPIDKIVVALSGRLVNPRVIHEAVRFSRLLDAKLYAVHIKFPGAGDLTMMMDPLPVYTEEDLREIVELLLRQVNENVAAKEIKINLREEAKDWIIRKTCHDRSYGARPLRRAIQRYIEDSLAELIIEGKLKEKQTLTIYLEGDALYYRPKGSQKQGVPLSYTV